MEQNMHMLCLLSLKFLNNKEESMEKRKGVSKLIVAILLLMILMIYIVTSVESVSYTHLTLPTKLEV